MSNRPFEDFPIDPNKESGTELAETLNRFAESVDSNNLGFGRPSYLGAGGLWSKGQDGAIDLYLFDGTKDVLVAGSGTADGGMAISETPPANPATGDLWMRLPNNIVMIYNGTTDGGAGYWFQFPSSGGGSGSGGDLPAGLARGQTLKWNGTAWEPTDVLRIHPSGVEAVDVSGKLHLHPVGTDPNGADMSRGPYGSVFESQFYWNATDGWTGIANDWSVSFIRPNDDNLNPNRRNAFDIIADKFVVRLSPAPQDDPWYDREIVFRAEEKSVSIGARDYRSKVYMHGDFYVGMSENFYGKYLPTNPDTKPGTTFCGGMSMLGTYIEGEPLTPINQQETDDPSLIRQRAFEKDCALDMALNPIYNTANPDDPRWATLRSRMCVTVEWIEKNAIVDDGSGTVVSKTSTILGDTNDDSHQLIGDVYVGYDNNAGLPDNNDSVGGTLFCNRGIIVGRNNTGNASISMENNLIVNLGNGVYGNHAVNLDQLRGYRQEMAASIVEAVSKSTKFAELKENLLEAMGEFL
jgi:hypothetical protein